MASSSSEEDDDAFKESANCDYIHRLVNSTNFHPDSKQKATLRVAANGGNPLPKETDFENFLAQRLAKRLDERIKIVEKKPSNSEGSIDSGGIKLFSCSPLVAELKETTEETPQRKRVASEPNVDYKERAREAAVSTQWVCDVSNTAHWKDSKRARLMKTKMLKTLTNGGLECEPLQESDL